jgi:hypothetical protein
MQVPATPQRVGPPPELLLEALAVVEALLELLALELLALLELAELAVLLTLVEDVVELVVLFAQFGSSLQSAHAHPSWKLSQTPLLSQLVLQNESVSQSSQVHAS